MIISKRNILIFILLISFVIISGVGVGYGIEKDYSTKIVYGTWVGAILRDLPDTNMVMKIRIDSNLGVAVHIANPAEYDLVGIGTYNITTLTSLKLTIAASSYLAFVLGKLNLIDGQDREIFRTVSNGITIIVLEFPNKEKLIELIDETGNLFFIMAGQMKTVNNQTLFQIINTTLNLISSTGL